MKTLIVLLNGPPRVGKDTVGDLIKRVRGAQAFFLRKERFAAPIKTAVNAMIGQSAHWEPEDKGEPLPIIGMSWRRACIWYSESVMKPKFGSNIFGRLASMRIRDDMNYLEHTLRISAPAVYVITDSGFYEEAAILIKNLYAANRTHFCLIRLTQDGKTFDGDSRSYIEGLPNCSEYYVDNAVGELDKTMQDIGIIINHELNLLS